jgi:hypothetical protein
MYLHLPVEGWFIWRETEKTGGTIHFYPQRDAICIALYIFARGDCFIRLVCTYSTYLHPIKAHDHRAYFGFVSKSRVKRSHTAVAYIWEKSWSFAVKSAKTRNRDNPISTIVVGGYSDFEARTLLFSYLSTFFICFWWIARCGSCKWRVRPCRL